MKTAIFIVLLAGCGGTYETVQSKLDLSETIDGESVSTTAVTTVTDMLNRTTDLASSLTVTVYDMTSTTTDMTQPPTPPPDLPSEYSCIHLRCYVGNTYVDNGVTENCGIPNDLYCGDIDGFYYGNDSNHGSQVPGPCKTDYDCINELGAPASTCSLISGATWGRCCPGHTSCTFTN